MKIPLGFKEYQGALGRTRPTQPCAAWFAALPDDITFTVDVEPEGGAQDEACLRATHRLMEMVEAGGGRGTFFVLGALARRRPELVREIAARGHEVASHGLHHRALARSGPAALPGELAEARAVLEDITGSAVLGFRAPLFSLDRRSAWAAPMIAEAGFAYSSSVIPAWNPMHGWPGMPRAPFRHAGGLLEVPAPLGRIGPLSLPFLGGMYLRWLPPWRLRGFAAQHARSEALWSYCHPYDLDGSGEIDPQRGRLARFFMARNRGLMGPRLAGLVEGRVSRPFAARLPGLAAAADQSKGAESTGTRASERQRV